MKILYIQGLCAFTTFLFLALAILARRRKLTHEDIGPLFSTFMAASTVPVAIHLCSFVLPMPRDPGALTFPDLYALYISAAGLILLVSSCVTICQLFATRIRRQAVTDGQADMSTSRGGQSGNSGTSRSANRRKMG